jgi:hypothetical protein
MDFITGNMQKLGSASEYNLSQTDSILLSDWKCALEKENFAELTSPAENFSLLLLVTIKVSRFTDDI